MQVTPKYIEAFQKKINGLFEEQQRISQELYEAEANFSDLLETSYVVCQDGESFDNHMVEVSYNNGYYNSIDEAIESVEKGNSYAVYNLKGRSVAIGSKE